MRFLSKPNNQGLIQKAKDTASAPRRITGTPPYLMFGSVIASRLKLPHACYPGKLRADREAGLVCLHLKDLESLASCTSRFLTSAERPAYLQSRLNDQSLGASEFQDLA
jgi:hypothetical protein